MTGVVLGALRERGEGEERVAVSPASVTRLLDGGVSVLVESGAGVSAWFTDADYVAAGAAIASLQDIIENADVIACVRTPPVDVISRIGSASAGSTTGSARYLAGLLGTATDPWTAEQLRTGNMIGLDLTLLPRTISSAQSMDALTSQASVAGYKAAILAADTFGRYFPMMMTAAGTVRPTQMLVLGTGIAGLQAIGTALRLGAEVTGYDVRPESRAEVQSLGASFLDTASVANGGVANGGVANGYARELTSDEHASQQRAVQDAIARFDIVITTASVPGARPPMLVTAAALNRMRPGSVVIDMAAGSFGGNVEGSTAESTVVTPTGVTVIGAASLPSRMPAAASMAYARNIADFVLHFVRSGSMTIVPTDQIDSAVVVHEPLSTERQEAIA